jgi:hypothetical protein
VAPARHLAPARPLPPARHLAPVYSLPPAHHSSPTRYPALARHRSARTSPSFPLVIVMLVGWGRVEEAKPSKRVGSGGSEKDRRRREGPEVTRRSRGSSKAWRW